MKNPALEYAEAVLNDTIPACELVKKACKRFKNDLKNYTFNEKKAAQAVTLIEAQRHVKGEWAYAPREDGTRGPLNLKLELWQKFIVYNLFGFYHPDGRRKYTRAYLEMPKKQGKSPLAAAIANVILIQEAGTRPEIYSAATKLDQAAIVWDYAAQMFKGLSEEFELQSQVTESFNNKRIIYEGGVFRPVAYDERGKNDGLSVNCAIIDEYHAHPSDHIYDILARGTAAKTNPLLLAITTAGHDKESACYKHREYCTKVLDGTFVDEDLFALIFTCDDGDAWDDEKTHRKANPNYGISVKPEYLKAQIAEARESGIKRDAFKIKHLNIWTDSYSTWILSEDLKKCIRNYTPPDGERCYIGLDLASSHDFTAMAINFSDSENHHIISRYYLPEQKLRDWPGHVGKQLAAWANEGYLTITPGNTTDYDYIEKDIKEFAAKYNVVSVGYDTWNAPQLAAKLIIDGINMRPFNQGIGSISHPTKRTESFIMSGKLTYDGNPLTTWMFANVSLYTDANLNVKVVKSKDRDKKVDGVVAMIMSVGEAIDTENKENWFFTPIIA